MNDPVVITIERRFDFAIGRPADVQLSGFALGFANTPQAERFRIAGELFQKLHLLGPTLAHRMQLNRQTERKIDPPDGPLRAADHRDEVLKRAIPFEGAGVIFERTKFPKSELLAIDLCASDPDIPPR